MVYFNEHDRFAAEWLGNLFPDATVDTRSITDVASADVLGFRRCHFFGGVAGWELALQLARWPTEWPVWTGSCPCQPFSNAGKGKGFEDERHLWPEFFRLIGECLPPYVVGEQVASKAGLAWLDTVFTDLEGAGYTCWAADLPASIYADHKRQRLFWLAYSEQWATERHRFGLAGETAGVQTEARQQRVRIDVGDDVPVSGLAYSRSSPSWAAIQTGSQNKAKWQQKADKLDGHSVDYGLDNTEQSGLERHGGHVSDGDQSRRFHTQSVGPAAASSDALVVLACRDGKARRAKRGSLPLAYGIPRDLGSIIARVQRMGGDSKALRRDARKARTNRVGRLRGYGNAIDPRVAALFLRAGMKAIRNGL